MGLWTGIKYAINSTLGTKEFEPLDKLITNQYRLVASDNVYKQFEDIKIEFDEDEPDGLNRILFQKIKMLHPATIRVKGKIICESTKVSYKFQIFRNDTPVYEYTRPMDSSISHSFNTDINLEAGDILSFRIEVTLKSGGSSATFEAFKLCGDIVQNIYKVVE